MSLKSNDEFEVDQRIAVTVYKWLKIAQSLILVALGAIFIICSIFSLKTGSEQNLFAVLPVCIGVVLSIFGLLDLLAGYYLHRNLMSEEVLLGSVSLSVSIVLFVKAGDSYQLLSEVLNIFLVSMLFCYAVMCVIYGIDRLIGKKGLEKNVKMAVFSFIGAALLLVGGILYAVLEKKYSNKISQWMFLVVGLVLIIIGLASFVTLLVKVRETNKALKLEEKKKEDAEEDKKEDENTVVKVVELGDLKKERRRGKKVFSKEKVGETHAFHLDEQGNIDYIADSDSSSDKKDSKK